MSSDLLSWLYSRQKFGIKLGLEDNVDLFKLLKIDFNKLKYIHVAGTNGKGSTATYLASLVDYDAGLFTSPHLVSFNERIRVVSGDKFINIYDDDIKTYLGYIKKKLIESELRPTFFEISFAMAVMYFLEKGLEYAVIETGLGGRLDATNIISPLASVLTPVGLDHQKILGDSLGAIAYEKAGIIKDKIPVFSAQQNSEVIEVFSKKVREKKTTIKYNLSEDKNFQKQNRGLAKMVLDELNLPYSDKKIILHGRHEKNGNYILDVAHNEHAVKNLFKTYKRNYGMAKLPIIFSCVRDKDCCRLIEIVLPIVDELILVEINNSRRRSLKNLKNDCRQVFDGKITCFKFLKDAIDYSDVFKKVLLFGSVFLVGEFLALRSNKNYEISEQ